MKRKLCSMLLLVALFLIGISALFAYAPPQEYAGCKQIQWTTQTVEVINNNYGGGHFTVFEDGLFAIGRIT